MHSIFSHSTFIIFLTTINYSILAQNFTKESIKLVNSIYDEKAPFIAPDGQTIYFTRANHPENVGGKKDLGDIWFSTWQNDHWSIPVHAGQSINNSEYNAVLGFSSTGGKIFLVGHYRPDGQSSQTQGIAVAQKTGNNWSTPTNIYIPYFKDQTATTSGYFNVSLGVFVFSAQGYETYGAQDIYVSTLTDGQWTDPINCGKIINSKFQEMTPWLSDDGKKLYFSANIKIGVGSFDIYESSRVDFTWNNWTIPINLSNLSNQINTNGRELFFNFFSSLNIGLYTSTQDSNGYGDIQVFHPPTSVSFVAVENQEPKPTKDDRLTPHTDWSSKFIFVHGKILDAKLSQPLDMATVTFQDDTVFTAVVKQGYFQVFLPRNKQYNLSIIADGYIEGFEKIDLKTFERDSVEINFNVQPLLVGAKINLKNVLFKQHTSQLLPDSFDELNAVVHFLKNHPTIKIFLGGHTDNYGSATANVKLSSQRVECVKDYLVSQGIDAHRISGKGFGGSAPLTEFVEVESTNRRVEFTIVQ